MPIQFRSGNEAELLKTNLVSGEPAYCRDSKKIFIGNGTGGASVIYTNSDLGARVPIGTVVFYAGESIPYGFLACNGQAASRKGYPDLFAAIGTKYGSGDGTTTFNVPDMRGRVPVGRDTSQSEFNQLGKIGGEKNHRLTVDELASHVHVLENGNYVLRYKNPNGNTGQSGNAAFGETLTIKPAGGDQPHNTLQPYITLNAMIAAIPSPAGDDLISIHNNSPKSHQDIREALTQKADTSYVNSQLNLKADASAIRKNYVSHLSAKAQADTTLTISDAAKYADFTAINVLGKSIQNGIPSPSSPIPIIGLTPTSATVNGTAYTLQTLSEMYSLPNGIADSYDIVSGLETRNIGKIVFDGSSYENWSYNSRWSTGGFAGVYIKIPDKMFGVLNMYCDKFTVERYKLGEDGSLANECCFGEVGTNVVYLGIDKNRLTTADLTGFRMFLQSNPVTVYYQLADPITIQHTSQTIPQNYLNNTISADGAGISVDYSKDLESAFLDQTEYATSLEARIAQLEILINK